MPTSNGECEALCSSVATSTCVDVALMSQEAHEGVQSTVCKTLYLNCVPIPYVAFQQLFFKNSVFKPNETLVNQSALFNQYVLNNDRHITNTGSECVLDNAAVANPLNLYEQMKILYEQAPEEGQTNPLPGCWDTCSKIKFTKSLIKLKKLTDLTQVCPVECSLSLDDMFCALEANDEALITISEETNMPEPPDTDQLPCLPKLSENTLTGGINNTAPNITTERQLTSDQFVWVPDGSNNSCDKGPVGVCITITDCSGTCAPSGEFYVAATQASANVQNCDGGAFDSGGTILISGIYIDGIAGAGGQYILSGGGTDTSWKVTYWEASAIVNITTRLKGKVPLKSGDVLHAAQLLKDASNNINHIPVPIANKEVVLDIVWRFKVDLTPASSGSGGFGYHRTTGGEDEGSQGVAYGWSFPTIRMSDDRQRKSIPRDEAIKLMASLSKIKSLTDDVIDGLVAAAGE